VLDSRVTGAGKALAVSEAVKTKILFSLVLGLGFSSLAFAGLGSEARVTEARESYERLQKAAETGSANPFDVLGGERHLLQTQLALDANDAKAFHALVINVDARLALAKKAFEMGSATSADVDLIKSERLGLKEGCAERYSRAKARASAGDATDETLRLTIEACQALYK